MRHGSPVTHCGSISPVLLSNQAGSAGRFNKQQLAETRDFPSQIQLPAKRRCEFGGLFAWPSLPVASTPGRCKSLASWLELNPKPELQLLSSAFVSSIVRCKGVILNYRKPILGERLARRGKNGRENTPLLFRIPCLAPMVANLSYSVHALERRTDPNARTMQAELWTAL